MSSGLRIVLAYRYYLNYRMREKFHKCAMLRTEIGTDGKSLRRRRFNVGTKYQRWLQAL